MTDMKAQLFAILIAIFLFAACGKEPMPAPTATADVQATVDTAVSTTATADAKLQERVDTAVDEAATNTVAAATAATTPAPETAVSTEEASVMSEEELAALIEQTVAEAATATESYATATTTAAVDDTITVEDVETIEIYAAGAEEAIALAEELIYLYETLYADLTVAAIDDMTVLLAELDELNQNLEAMIVVLEEINTTLNAGLALAEETITQLETAAATAIATAATAQAQAQIWQTTVTNEIANRAVLLETVQPQTIAATQQEALNQVAAYLTTVQTALSDQSLSAAELSTIVQANADVVASLQAQGGPQLQSLATNIDAATTQLAAGNLNAALVSLNDLNSLASTLPGLPVEGFSLPSRPGGTRP